MLPGLGRTVPGLREAFRGERPEITTKVRGPQNGAGGGWAGLPEVSEGRVAIFPHPSAAAQQAVGPQPIINCERWTLRSSQKKNNYERTAFVRNVN